MLPISDPHDAIVQTQLLEPLYHGPSLSKASHRGTGGAWGIVPLPVGEGWVDEGFAATGDVTSMTPPGVALRMAAQVEF